MEVVHKNSRRKTAEQFPNEGKTVSQNERNLPEDNHFRNHSQDEIRKKYLQWMVISEYMNQILELPVNATFQELGNRAYQLFQANKEKDNTPETVQEA